MSIRSRIIDCCEGLTRHQVYEALPDVGVRTIDNALAVLLAIGRIHIKEYAAPVPGHQRMKGIFSSRPGTSVPYPTRPKTVRKARLVRAKKARVEQPKRLPVPASIFHLGWIITVDQRGWKAVNESFRRRA